MSASHWHYSRRDYADYQAITIASPESHTDLAYRCGNVAGLRRLTPDAAAMSPVVAAASRRHASHATRRLRLSPRLPRCVISPGAMRRRHFEVISASRAAYAAVDFLESYRFQCFAIAVTAAAAAALIAPRLPAAL